MVSINSFLSGKGTEIFSPLKGRNTEVRSLQTVRRQVEILVSLIGFPVLCCRKCSMNCRMEVWSHTCEFTYPPRLQGDAITSGTRYPNPIGLSRISSAPRYFFACSSSRVTYSRPVSIPADTLPVPGLCGAVNGGTWSK